MKLTPAQYSILAQRPYYSDLRLSIYAPKTVLACRVASGTYTDGTYANGSNLVNYGTIATGTYTNVEPGITCYIGSAAGKADKGKLRVRNITPTTIKFAKNSQNWVMGDYLTLVNFHEIWPVYSSVFIDPSEEDIIVYKDDDIVYSNENALMGSLICAGPNRAAYLDQGQALLYYSASGTYNVLGENLAYFWNFEGGTPTFYSGSTPGYIQYTAAGHYVTKLRVTSTSGATGTTYRHISVYPSKDDFTYKNWGITDMSGSREQGGYYTKIWLRTQIPEIMDGSLVVIQGDHWAGTNKLTFGGNYEHGEDIFFVGYIVDGSIEYDYQNARMTFDVMSPTALMKLKEAYSLSVSDSCDTPIRWEVIQNLSFLKAVFHYLKWSTTVLETCDVQALGITDKLTAYFDLDRASMYDTLLTYVQQKMGGEVVSDMQGKIWIEKNPGAINNATGTLVEELTLTNYEWKDLIVVDEQNSQKLSQLEGGGYGYIGCTGVSTPLLSMAPGDVPGYFGKKDTMQGFQVADQSELNTLTGNLYAWRTAKYPNVELQLAGNYRNFDLAPQGNIPLTVRPADTYYRLNWNKKPFTLRDIAWEYDADNKLILPRIVLHEITQGSPGITQVIPAPTDLNFPTNVPEVPEFGDFLDVPFLYVPPANPPDIPPAVTPPPEVESTCRSDINAAPNGPYLLQGLAGAIYESTLLQYNGLYYCWMRPGTFVNKTSYTINMKPQIYQNSDWEADLGANWFTVYALSDTFSRLATGVPDINTGEVRTGHFSPAGGADISGIEIAVGGGNYFLDHSFYNGITFVGNNSHSWYVPEVANEGVTPPTGVNCCQMNFKFTSAAGYLAVQARATIYVDWMIPGDPNPADNYRISITECTTSLPTSGPFYNNGVDSVSNGGVTLVPTSTGTGWNVSATDPNYFGITFYPYNGSAGETWGPGRLTLLNLEILVGGNWISLLQPNRRLLIDSAYLWNVCKHTV